MTATSIAFDRAGARRDEPEVIERLRADAATGVIVIRDSRARAADGGLVRVAPEDVTDAEWALLGRASDGTALLLAALPATAPGTEESIDAAPEEAWLGLRDAGGALSAEDTETLVTAIALAAWIRDASFCSACGAATQLRQAGWSRQCSGCDREHFPRTDPAVIVAIESADGERLLLGANASWHGRMYSCFAGFVEAGESLEGCVHREIFEEAGVRLTSLSYVSSQPWPYPRSLMVGFRAVADEASAPTPDGVEILDARWFTRAEIAAALDGDGPGLPGAASIARGLIMQWYEERA